MPLQTGQPITRDDLQVYLGQNPDELLKQDTNLYDHAVDLTTARYNYEFGKTLEILFNTYGVNSSAELPEHVRQALYQEGFFHNPDGLYQSRSGSGWTTVRDFFTKNPALWIAAAGAGAMFAAPAAGAAAGGASTGTGAAAGGAAGGTGITAGAGGATGITAGTTTGAIGGGALGSGLTAGGTSAGAATAAGAGAGTAAGASALDAGYFGSETAYPVAGGETAAASGVGGGSTGSTATTASQQTALGKVLAGTATMDDYLALTGQIAPALLGAYASDKQTDAYKDLAAQYAAMGAPYRSRLAELYANPNAFLTSPEVTVPVQQGTDIVARSLSTQGNPIASGNALQKLQSYSADQLFGRLGQEKDRLAGFGGLSAYNQAAPQAATNAIGSQANIYNAVGAGMADVFGTRRQRSLADILREGRY